MRSGAPGDSGRCAARACTEGAPSPHPLLDRLCSAAAMGCNGSTSKDAVQGGANHHDNHEEDDYQPLTQEEVNARIQCCDSTLYYDLGESNYKLRYAYLSQRGYYPEDLYKNNQDSFKIIPAFNGNKNTIFFGVFDGHGSDGDACSYFVRDNIEAHLKLTMSKYPDDFERAYKEAFTDLNQQMHMQARGFLRAARARPTHCDAASAHARLGCSNRAHGMMSTT
eukprot:5862088-Pleurochrysis_carterae.AAC.2